MFEAKLANAATLKKIIDAIKDLVKDAPFDCSESSMCLQAMDDSHVALVSLKLEVGLFESYRCDRVINLGLSLASVAKALKCANNEDTCLIRCEENDCDTVVFAFEDVKRDKKQEVTVKMVDIDSEHLGIPDQSYSAIVSMPSSEFQKTCRDLSLFSDSIAITVTKAGIVFTGKGETGSSVVTYAPSKNVDDDDDGVTVDVAEPVSIIFSIKYMNYFTKASGLSSKVLLSLSNDVPIVIEYNLDGNGHLRFYLAPKIDEDDEKMND